MGQSRVVPIGRVTLSEYIDAVEPPTQTVTVLNRQRSDPIYELLVEFFRPLSVEVREASLDAAEPTDAVLLHDGDEPTAVSSLDDLYASALGTNVDRYATSTRGLAEMETPDVVTGLHDVRIRAERGNKFVLIQMSRHVEAMAYDAGAGEIHSSFQRLSRLVGERGTREVYRELSERGVDGHVYGVPDETPDDLPVTVHAVDDEEMRQSWFVLHDGGGNDGGKAALLAREVAEDTYRGFWTFDSDRVDELLAYVTETYASR